MERVYSSQEYHNIYPEFNPPREDMIAHKERSGADALWPLLLAALLAAALSFLSLTWSAMIRPVLLEMTPTSAQVQVTSDLTDSGVAYPLTCRLVSCEEDEPLDGLGRLRLSRDQAEALPAVGESAVDESLETMLFGGLRPGGRYLLLFYALDDEGREVLRQEALLIELRAQVSNNTGRFSKNGVNAFAEAIAEARQHLGDSEADQQVVIAWLNEAYNTLLTTGRNQPDMPRDGWEEDITVMQLIEASNFSASDKGSRFGTPQYWTVENYAIQMTNGDTKNGIDGYPGHNTLMLGRWASEEVRPHLPHRASTAWHLLFRPAARNSLQYSRGQLSLCCIAPIVHR